MLWDRQIPRLRVADAHGLSTEITVFAGALGELRPPAPPPDSWAASPESDVAIWSIVVAPGAAWTLPAARDHRTARTLYFFSGRTLQLDERVLSEHGAIEIVADRAVRLVAPDDAAEIVLLQGRPIGEPVAQYGPFVMNTRAELEQAFYDYRRTQFGGWPYPANDPVHPRQRGRFAKHADGRVEEAPT
jgi:redox-sensitive bicupin YhaK (pirin superfamily)